MMPVAEKLHTFHHDWFNLINLIKMRKGFGVKLTFCFINPDFMNLANSMSMWDLISWKRRWRPEADTRQHTLTDTRAFCFTHVCVCLCVTWGLEVERNHLASSVPENLRNIITGVHSTSFGVDSTHLLFVVAAHLIQANTSGKLSGISEEYF